jgi:benzoyl-CoA reductase/2-hydroxyglutaryl-CoA dehydratase subunit BcrC/BadD/HgdB
VDSLPKSSTGNDKVKLMLCAYNFNIAEEVSQIAERMGASVNADDLINSVRYCINDTEAGSDVMQSLADSYLLEVPAPGLYSFNEKMDFIQQSMSEAGAKGLIYVVQSMCDAYSFEYAIMQDKFEERNIPYLHLEVEDSPTSVEHMNTRIQSFVESLS